MDAVEMKLKRPQYPKWKGFKQNTKCMNERIWWKAGSLNLDWISKMHVIVNHSSQHVAATLNWGNPNSKMLPPSSLN